MKYKSELIKEMIDSRGHEKSSIHYQSECIETWIEGAKGGYPKLCDYQSEWLSYINKIEGGGTEKPNPEEPKPEEPNPEPPIGEFPYETVSTNTTATVNHVVPYAYKSAILKGNTLMNVVSEQGFGGNKSLFESRFEDSPFNERETFTIFVVNPKVTTIKVGLFNATSGGWLREQQYNVANNKKVVYTVPSGNTCCKYVGVVVNTANVSTGFENSLVIVSGDKSNLEIQNYFEGMQSVQMVGLTTTGKNLINVSTLNNVVTEDNNECIVGGGWVDNGGSVGKPIIIPVNIKSGHTYTLSCTNKVTKHFNKFYIVDDIIGNAFATVQTYIGQNTTKDTFTTSEFTFTATRDYKYLTTNTGEASAMGYIVKNTIQVEEGSTPTPYEPHQSNILKVNEDVTLRSNESVYDELDLLTGKLTQRIGENNEVLSQEVVKSVKLSITNQDGITLSTIKPIEGTMHITPTGEPIAPTAVLEVPVEAITQNLASFIDLEMEE